MKHFKSFFKTTVGKKSQSEPGEVKLADGAYDASNPGSAAAAASISSAFGGGRKMPEPEAAPSDVSQGGGTLASRITSGLTSLRKKFGAD